MQKCLQQTARAEPVPILFSPWADLRLGPLQKRAPEPVAQRYASPRGCGVERAVRCVEMPTPAFPWFAGAPKGGCPSIAEQRSEGFRSRFNRNRLLDFCLFGIGLDEQRGS